ncbi:MAG: transcription antitermination factor NusB [Christensenellaceae bacterium]
MERRLAREAAMCLYYERAIKKDPHADSTTLIDMGDVLHRARLDDENLAYIDSALHLYEQHLSEIDACIEQYCRTWKLDRLSRVDLSILRLAVAEMHYIDEIPYKVSVNEAVELAKKYSDEKSPNFINGILRAISQAENERQA